MGTASSAPIGPNRSQKKRTPTKPMTAFSSSQRSSTFGVTMFDSIMLSTKNIAGGTRARPMESKVINDTRASTAMVMIDPT
jgi:hypothetical protein